MNFDTNAPEVFARRSVPSNRILDLSLFITIFLISVIVMLALTSPELSFDEADYASSTRLSWTSLVGGSDYQRHNHGPMSIYLSKLGQEVLPSGVFSIEVRSRLFISIVASLGIGFLYLALRNIFNASLEAAMAASSLLLFSMIRIQETNIIGPHQLMLACLLAIIALGYHWRDRPGLASAIGLGLLFGFGALSMTYVLPTAVCWAIAVSFGGTEWYVFCRKHIKVSWTVFAVLATASITAMMFWPPSVVQQLIIRDFLTYLRYPNHPTFVGNTIFEVTPRWAIVHWLTQLDLPIVLVSFSIISMAAWKIFKNRRLSPKHVYLAIFLLFFLATTLKAHLAGARNTLLLIGVLCITTGALFDEALEYRPRLIRFLSVIVIVAAALNLSWFALRSNYIPFLATKGYQAFLIQADSRLNERAKALVYGLPILRFYAQQSGKSIAWEVSEIPWTTSADAPLSPDVRYVLIPALVYDYMPAQQPMRRVVAAHWNVVWSFGADRIWGLRLYENPNPAIAAAASQLPNLAAPASAH
jgi:hypothetical protein